MPITTPYIVTKVMSLLKLRKNRDSLQSKVVVITGASSGLGEALAHTFYMAGCKIVLAARRKEELDRVRTDLLEMHSVRLCTQPSNKLNFFLLIFSSSHSFSFRQQVVTHPPVVVPMDITDLNALAEKIAQIEQMFGHIDILINNAGIGVRGDAVSMAVDLDVQVMLVNYFGAVAITKGSRQIFVSV